MVVPGPAWVDYGGIAFGGVIYAPSATSPWAVVTTRVGAFVSTNDGDQWTRLDTATTTHHITSAHFTRDGHLYLGTYGQGVMRSDQPLIAP